MKSPGQKAYEGYFDKCGGKSLVSGAPLPTWEGQADAIREAWEAAGQRVLQADGSGPEPGQGSGGTGT